MPAECLFGHSWVRGAFCTSLICKSYDEEDHVHAVDNIRLLMYLSMRASSFLAVQENLVQLILKRKAGAVMRRCFHACMLKREICSAMYIGCEETHTCALRRCDGKVGEWSPAHMGCGIYAPGDGSYEGPVAMECEPCCDPQRRLSAWAEDESSTGSRKYWVFVCSIACMNQALVLRDFWPGCPGWSPLRGTSLLSRGVEPERLVTLRTTRLWSI